MSKYVVTWTFMRHIKRNRQYKIVSKIVDAESEYMADFYMNMSQEAQSLYKLKYHSKLKACVEVTEEMFKY